MVACICKGECGAFSTTLWTDFLRLTCVSCVSGEYIALYQSQRAILKQRHQEKEEYISRLAQDKEEMKVSKGSPPFPLRALSDTVPEGSELGWLGYCEFHTATEGTNHPSLLHLDCSAYWGRSPIEGGSTVFIYSSWHTGRRPSGRVWLTPFKGVNWSPVELWAPVVVCCCNLWPSWTPLSACMYKAASTAYKKVS